MGLLPGKKPPREGTPPAPPACTQAELIPIPQLLLPWTRCPLLLCTHQICPADTPQLRQQWISRSAQPMLLHSSTTTAVGRLLHPLPADLTTGPLAGAARPPLRGARKQPRAGHIPVPHNVEQGMQQRPPWPGCFRLPWTLPRHPRLFFTPVVSSLGRRRAVTAWDTAPSSMGRKHTVGNPL